MKKSFILLLIIGALVVAPLPARADGISFGIPLPFPFVFYNIGPAEPAYSGYYRPYYGRPYYHRRAYYYSGYYRPRYYYGSRYYYYRPGWCW